MNHEMSRMTFPDMITGLRLVIAPVLVYLAYRGNAGVFVGVLIFSMLTDAFDGYFARRMHSSTPTGSVLDSRADLATYTAILVGGYLLWPELILRQRFYFGIVLGGYMISAVAGLMKFRRFPSFHTWSAKVSAVLLSISVLIMYGFKITVFFRIVSVLVVLSFIENICITMVLPEWRHDIPSIYHAYRSIKDKRFSSR